MNPKQKMKAKGYNLGFKSIYSLSPLHLTFLYFPLAWVDFSPSSQYDPLDCAHPGDKADTEEIHFSWLGSFPPPSQSCVSWRSKAEGSRSSCFVSWLVVRPWWPSQTPPSHHPLSWLSTLSNQRHWCGSPCPSPRLTSLVPVWRNHSHRGREALLKKSVEFSLEKHIS